MYPKFDSKHHWLQLRGIYGLAYYIILLFIPLLLWLLDMDWDIILLGICLWLCFTFVSDYRIVCRFPRFAELSTKELYPDFLFDLTGNNDWYPLMDDSSELYRCESFESPAMGDDILICRNKKNRLFFFHCYYSSEKQKEFAKLIKNHLKGKKYPLAITYYKKSNVIYRIDLTDGFDYPEDFRTAFFELREMI